MIMKILFGLLTLLPLTVSAQVVFNIQVPPAGMVQKEQLWNLSLINNSQDLSDAYLLLQLRNLATGETVLSAETGRFNLSKGIRVLTVRDIQPIQYRLGNISSDTRFIPIGEYVACYSLRSLNLKGEDILANECISLVVTPLSPPLLNSPPDKSNLETQTPQFTWMPPMPAEMFVNLTYDIIVTEVRVGQKPVEAIQTNQPTYLNTNIRNTSSFLPQSYTRLEPGKEYAWQVIARNGLDFAARTEVWTFTVTNSTFTEISPQSVSYIELGPKSGQSGINYISGKKVYVKYYSPEKEGEALISISDTEGNVFEKTKQRIVYGDNFLSFDLSQSFQPGQIYTLELTNSQQNKYQVVFCLKQS